MKEIKFINDKNFKEHVAKTIKTYGETLKSFDLKRFNSNIIDPIKLTFDSKVYNKSLQEIILNEIDRQRDKTNTNAIGYFHQNIFKYIENCEVPKEGFDVIFTRRDGKRVFVEMKNKHNTMNSSSAQKVYMRMQNKILEDPNCLCYLVEVIAKKSQNIPWEISVDQQKMSNDRIRRVSIDAFYEEVTGDKNAFYNVCKVLPQTIDYIIEHEPSLIVEKDTVLEELSKVNPDLLKSLYLLAFSGYEGFEDED